MGANASKMKAKKSKAGHTLAGGEPPQAAEQPNARLAAAEAAERRMKAVSS
jgi:hypothetical protein